MKAKTMLVTLALCFVGVMCFAADDPQIGTWKLNEAKSKIVSSVIGSAGAGEPSNPGSPASLREP